MPLHGSLARAGTEDVGSSFDQIDAWLCAAPTRGWQVDGCPSFAASLLASCAELVPVLSTLTASKVHLDLFQKAVNFF